MNIVAFNLASTKTLCVQVQKSAQRPFSYFRKDVLGLLGASKQKWRIMICKSEPEVCQEKQRILDLFFLNAWISKLILV